MNPLARKRIEKALVAELRRLAPGAKPDMRAIRLRIAGETGGCTLAELTAAISALRYAGKLAFDRIELSDSMKLDRPAAPVAAADDPEPGPGPAYQPGPGSGPKECVGEGFVPRASLHRSGVRGAQTRWAGRPAPAPAHEPEVAREVREEGEAAAERRRRARSSGSVRLPVELKRFAVPDMSLGEAVGTMLADTPQALLRAVQRKHPELWRRALLLGRARGESPMLTLAAAIEAGIERLERLERSHKEELSDVA